MEGKRVKRKPEPIAISIYSDMAKYLEMQPRTSEFVEAILAREHEVVAQNSIQTVNES